MNSDIVDLYKKVLDDQRLSVAEKRKLLNDIRSLIPGPQNRWNFRWVIWPLGIVAVSLPVLYFVHLFYAKTLPGNVPDGLLSLASAAVGALAGFLAPYGQRAEQEGATPPTTRPAPADAVTPNPTANGQQAGQEADATPPATQPAPAGVVAPNPVVNPDPPPAGRLP